VGVGLQAPLVYHGVKYGVSEGAFLAGANDLRMLSDTCNWSSGRAKARLEVEREVKKTGSRIANLQELYTKMKVCSLSVLFAVDIPPCFFAVSTAHFPSFFAVQTGPFLFFLQCAQLPFYPFGRAHCGTNPAAPCSFCSP
jgi:hypothetical protein